VLAERVEQASTPWKRMVGLLGRDTLPPGHALHLSPCGSIHTCGMRFSLDVVFLDGAGTVCRVFRDVRPLRVCSGGRGARSALEMAHGWAGERLPRPGERVVFEAGPA
jgi:hypothetical protein